MDHLTWIGYAAGVLGRGSETWRLNAEASLFTQAH